ncbi:peroxisomal biogenesis factor 2 [Hysterangium stoloniferum]|nr:peroxisomal biogenesis factor 2 [Hysterangium stoloniferum]
MSPASWQQAWELAQPRLEAIRKSTTTFHQSIPRVLRVGQLDAELLDQELLQILKEPFYKALGLIHSSYRSRFEPELNLLVYLVLYKFSVWDVGATYGAKLQNLRYRTKSVSHLSHPIASGLPRQTLLLHAAATMLVPYIHSRTRLHALSKAWPDAPSSDPRRKAWDILTHMESLNGALGLTSFVIFLCDGRYRTWIDRLLRLRLVPSQSTSNRQVSYEFMNRQMVWHAFTEFLIFLLPLINTHSLRRRITRAVSDVSLSDLVPSQAKYLFGLSETLVKGKEAEQRGKFWSLPEDQCAICAEDAAFSINEPGQDTYVNLTAVASHSVDATMPPQYPLNTAYMTSCAHQYCYVCISDRMLRAADEGEAGWGCLRCRSVVTTADRVESGLSVESQSDLDIDQISLESEDFLTTTSE